MALGLGLGLESFLNSSNIKGIPTSNILFYLRYNGNVNDASGNHTPVGNSITYANGLYSGSSNESAEWNANTDYVYVPNDATLNFGNGATDSPFSISLAVNFDAAAIGSAQICRLVTKWGNASLFNTDRQYSLVKKADDYIRFICLDQSSGGFIYADYETALSASTNYHITATYDGSSSENGLKLYIDGSLVTTVNALSGSYTAMESFTNDLYIGNVEDTSVQNANRFDGKMDGLAMWNKELSASEVSSIYAIQSAGTEIL